MDPPLHRRVRLADRLRPALSGSPRLRLDRLPGELCLLSAPWLERELRALERRRPRLVVVDLRRLSFIDCRGLAAILAASRSAGAQRCRLVVAAEERARRLFALAGAAQPPQLVWDPRELDRGA